MSAASLGRFAALGCIWGSSFLLIKVAVGGLAPLQVALGRLVAGVVVLAVVARLRRVALPREPVVWAHLAAMGVVANIIPFALFAWGEERVTSALAGVLNGATPLFTVLAAAGAARLGWHGERLSPRRVGGLALGFVGVVVVVEPWQRGALAGELGGQLACLAAAACYGVAFVYTRRFLTPTGYRPLALATGQLGAATVLLGVAAPFVARSPVELDTRVVAATVVLGAVMTGFAYLLYYRLIGDEGATTASMVTYVIPIAAVLLGWAVLGEPVGWSLPVGGTVVIIGVALAEGRVGGRRQPPVPAGTPAHAVQGRRAIGARVVRATGPAARGVDKRPGGKS